MLEYIIKSSFCLVYLFIFYYFILRNIKVFKFNRYYLLSSLVISIIVPLLKIDIGINVPISHKINELSYGAGKLIAYEDVQVVNDFFTIKNIIISFYVIISILLLLRFFINIYKIIKRIKGYVIKEDFNCKIVLVDDCTLPYSFFKYIFVNRSEYENKEIKNELLDHEQVHCLQYHSIDILLIEFVKIFLWFNPIIWLFKKEIQLNHEYFADNEVLMKHSMISYQNILLNLIFRNNSTYLASNFNYSLTKKRLIMMKTNNSALTAIIRKIAVLPVVLILAITVSFSQENIQKSNLMNYEKEWWYPLLQRHNIEPKAFNNLENVFEMGSTNTINNGIVTLKDALFLVKVDDVSYKIIKSPLAYHNIEENIIEGEHGIIETYNFKMKNRNALETFEVKTFKYQLDKR